VRFEDQLTLAAIQGDRDEAYAGLSRIAKALGIWGQTMDAQSIREVADMCVAKITQAPPAGGVR
jgi:hypothetical protein